MRAPHNSHESTDNTTEHTWTCVWPNAHAAERRGHHSFFIAPRAPVRLGANWQGGLETAFQKLKRREADVASLRSTHFHSVHLHVTTAPNSVAQKTRTAKSGSAAALPTSPPPPAQPPAWLRRTHVSAATLTRRSLAAPSQVAERLQMERDRRHHCKCAAAASLRLHVPLTDGNDQEQ